MNANQRYNQVAIKQFRKELTAMLGDITDIDIKCLNKAVNIGLTDIKRNTHSRSGFMRKSWRSAPAIKSKSGEVTKTIENNSYYSSYVNYGHRIVNGKGETIGWVKGQFMLEKAINKVDKALEDEFKKEVEGVSRKHDK